MQEEIQQEASNIEVRNTLFSPGSWQTKIDFINHLVLFNNLLIAVLAEREGGKSSFIRLLQDKLDPQIRSCVINLSPPCNIHELIAEITNQLHLKNDAVEPISFLELVRQINERRTPILLLLDNAQHLPMFLVKEMLEAIQSQKENISFHLCLVSDYSVVASYNQLAREVFSNSIHTIELGTLNELELKTYVTQKVAGNKQAEKLLSGDNLSQLYVKTGGCISKINAYLNNFKIESATVSSKIHEKRFRRISLASVSVLTVSILSFVLFSISKDRLPEYFIDNAKKISNSIIASSNWGAKKEQIVTESNFESEIAHFRDKSLHQLVYNGLPKKQILDTLNEGESDTQGVVDKVVVIPQINLGKAIHEAQAMKLKEENDRQATTDQKVAEKLVKGYTIQLLASHRISDIHRFAKEYKLQGQCLIRQVTRDDDSWYILTMGDFSSLEQANNALQKLNSELLIYKPWVRITNHLKLVG